MNAYLWALAALLAAIVVILWIIREAITVDSAKAGAALTVAGRAVGTAIGNAGRRVAGLFKRGA